MISDTTVIVLLYNTPIKLINNLKVFKKFNVIILDQSNDKIFKKKLLKILPNIKSYTLRDKNFGFARGVNELVKKVKTKYFFCIQPDVKIQEQSILKLRKTIIKNKKKAALIVPSINNVLNVNKKKQKKEVVVKNMIGAIFFADNLAWRGRMQSNMGKARLTPKPLSTCLRLISQFCLLMFMVSESSF